MECMHAYIGPRSYQRSYVCVQLFGMCCRAGWSCAQFCWDEYCVLINLHNANGCNVKAFTHTWTCGSLSSKRRGENHTDTSIHGANHIIQKTDTHTHIAFGCRYLPETFCLFRSRHPHRCRCTFPFCCCLLLFLFLVWLEDALETREFVSSSFSKFIHLSWPYI